MSDKQIVECAKRLVAKLAGEKYYTLNGEFSPKVQTEIKRMKHLCLSRRRTMSDMPQTIWATQINRSTGFWSVTFDGEFGVPTEYTRSPVWIPAEQFEAELTEPYAEEWVGYKDKRGNDQIHRAYLDIPNLGTEFHWWDCKTHEALPPTHTGRLYILKFMPPIPPLGEEQVSDQLSIRELVELLNSLAEQDLSEGSDIVDHPAHIAAITLLEFEQLQAKVERLDKVISDHLSAIRCYGPTSMESLETFNAMEAALQGEEQS